MRRIISLITIMSLTVACAVGQASAAERRPKSASASSPALPLPALMVAGSKDRTDLDVYALAGSTSVRWTPVGSNDWSSRVPGYNIVRTFTNLDGQLFVLLLNGNTGEAETFELNANGTVGKAPWWTGIHPVKELRCTSAEIYRVGTTSQLVTQDSFTGRVRTFLMNSDGSINLLSMTENILDDMRDKNLFRVYYSSFYGYQMIGVDTWSGEVAVYFMNMQKTAGAKWTRGWTSIDNLYLEGVTYRLLYKAAGDPFEPSAENNQQVGRFVIELVANNGVDAEPLQDTVIGDNYSSVRFFARTSREGEITGYGILCYRRTTGEYEVYDFNPKKGLDQLIEKGQVAEPTLQPAPPYADLQPCMLAGNTFLAAVSPDNANPMGFDQANQMAEIIHNAIADTTVGYQIALAQSGQTLYRRARGKLKLDHVSAAELDMTTHTQLEIASVAKMITALTVMKLAEEGQIDLNAPVSKYLAPGQVSSGSWATTTPVLNLLTHTTGLSMNSCKSDFPGMTVNCTTFLNTVPDLFCATLANGDYKCERSYNNSNIKVARKVIEFVKDVKTSSDIVTQTQKLWAGSVDLNDITCHMNPDAYYYGKCDGAADCYFYAGNSWRRVREVSRDDNWLPICSSNHWYASSRELMAFLGAIRYHKIISNQSLMDLLLATDLTDVFNSPTALSWEEPRDVNGESALEKAGNFSWEGVAARAYIARLPGNVDFVIQLNTQSDVYVPTVVTDAFKAVVPVH